MTEISLYLVTFIEASGQLIFMIARHRPVSTTMAAESD